MKYLVPIPPETAADFKCQKETASSDGRRNTCVKDNRTFDQVVVSEGCIIAVRGYAGVPFRFDEVETVTVNHKRWNFRTRSDKGRRPLKTSAATA